MIPVKGYAAFSPTTALKPFEFERRDPGPNDVVIDILFCGICHSDIHSARSEWGPNRYPLVPGHEITGRVSRVGAKVKGFKVGDLAGVGCYVHTCGICRSCKSHQEVYCEKKVHFTYGDVERDNKTPTQGGYATKIVVNDHYVLKIPKGVPLERAAPLLCAGITTYSPLKHWNVRKGVKVGVLGLGGLGHLAVKLAVSMGAEVTVISTSPGKEADAKRLGAKHFLLATSESALKTPTQKLDFILNTVSARHEVSRIIGLLRRDGTMVLVGASPEPLPLEPFSLIERRKTLTGSLIGGIQETQEMLDYCAKKKIYADVEVIPASQINEAYDRTVKQEARYRFVIDAATF